MEILLGRPRFAAFLLAQVAAVVVLLLPCNVYSQELTGVAQRFLQRHGVPCPFVLKVELEEEVATCQDGREWAMFWLEDEIAFVNPRTRELYKWNRALNASLPAIYYSPIPSNADQIFER